MSIDSDRLQFLLRKAKWEDGYHGTGEWVIRIWRSKRESILEAVDQERFAASTQPTEEDGDV